MKICVECSKEYKTGSLGKCSTCYMRKHRSENREKINAYARKRRASNRDRILAVEKKNRQKPEVDRRLFDGRLRKRFGITANQYDGMYLSQGGVCAICYKPEIGQRLSVDHCHKTGKVRGLLCDTCNTTLGKFEDIPERFISAAIYLQNRGK
jgi:hypothetical protein